MDIERWTAFATTPDAGNPAGVAFVADGEDLTQGTMQRVAADIGYSETAFVRTSGTPGTFDVSYFSPLAEVAFCGHATIATGVALARRHHSLDAVVLRTARVGDVPVAIDRDEEAVVAELSSPPARGERLHHDDLDRLLELFGWSKQDLDGSIPVEVANAGESHPVVALRDRATLASMTYPFDQLRALMEERGWTTVQIVHRTGPDTFESRNPFPVGGVVEDPATGAAAAAFGGLLRRHDLLPASGRFTVVQGADMGRRSVLRVDASGAAGDPVKVSGTAVEIGG